MQKCRPKLVGFLETMLLSMRTCLLVLLGIKCGDALRVVDNEGILPDDDDGIAYGGGAIMTSTSASDADRDEAEDGGAIMPTPSPTDADGDEEEVEEANMPTPLPTDADGYEEEDEEETEGPIARATATAVATATAGPGETVTATATATATATKGEHRSVVESADARRGNGTDARVGNGTDAGPLNGTDAGLGNGTDPSNLNVPATEPDVPTEVKEIINDPRLRLAPR